MKTPKNLQETIRNIRSKPQDRLSIFTNLPPNLQAQLLLVLNKHIVYDLLSHMPDNLVASALEHLDPDEATDVLQLLSKERQKSLLKIMNSQIKEAVERLIKFDPSTAAGLMNLDYIQVNENDTIAEVAKQFKVHEKRTGKLPTIIVVKDDGCLVGYLPGHELGFGYPRDKTRKYTRKIASIPHGATHDETIARFRTYPHAKIAVLGDKGQVLGIIYSDDALRLLHERDAASLYNFAGVAKEETVHDSAFTKINFRYKWLIINLATAFLASFTVSLFEGTISKYVLLAVYMPIIAGMGGNAGTQTMAVMVRGIALNQIDLKSYFATLKNEILSGLANGILNGLIVAAVVLAVNRDPLIAFVLFSAMIINLVVAGFFGTMIPLFMKKIGKDPASSATIFITTATDVLGFLAFLGLAKLLLP